MNVHNALPKNYLQLSSGQAPKFHSIALCNPIFLRTLQNAIPTVRGAGVRASRSDPIWKPPSRLSMLHRSVRSRPGGLVDRRSPAVGDSTWLSSATPPED